MSTNMKRLSKEEFMMKYFEEKEKDILLSTIDKREEENYNDKCIVEKMRTLLDENEFYH